MLLHDELRIDPAFARADAYVALAPGHRVVGTLCLFGERPPCDDPAALRLARDGTLRRATAPDMAAVHAELEHTWSQWSSPKRR